jgi:ADP-dependent NAD(P)H-hydrate dehydratase / NAD(P)H-hydrate epimerase
VRTPASPLYTTDRIRAIEHSAGSAGLMETAGLAAATLARDLAGEDGDAILVLAGPGNNGGDALVAARHLKAWWFRVSVVFAGAAGKLPPDAAAALDAWLAAGGTLETAIPCRKFGLVIDGLFGIGLSKPLQGDFAELVGAVNALSLPVLAIDIPSGLCADTGRVLGTAVRASHTLTFLGLKPGLFTLDGPDHAGEVVLTDLGVNAALHASTPGALLDTHPPLPPGRHKNAHKGSFGSAGILGGDTSMVGAALLAGRAALLSGAGRVYVGLLEAQAPAVDLLQPELMLRTPKALLDIPHLTALAVGPGLGRSVPAARELRHALQLPVALLLDADALHLLAGDVGLRQLFHARSAGNMLTPHPGEAAALLGCSIAELQADRIASALEIARTFNAITLLKGCGSIIATPDGRWFVNGSGNPGMSSAGMGDILCGLIVSLLGQGMSCEAACLLGVYLHGAAADVLARERGPVGLAASEVTLAARTLLNQWLA